MARATHLCAALTYSEMKQNFFCPDLVKLEVDLAQFFGVQNNELEVARTRRIAEFGLVEVCYF